ncbi:Topoisomerase 1-associated factor 1 [Mucor circinelloides]
MDEEAQEIEGTKGYILSLCSAIGGLEEIKQDDGTVGQIYCAGDEALACLRDLKKAIRIDSQNNEKIVLNTLKEHNVVKTDIVPLLLSYRNQRTEVADRFILACVELLVPMTWPLEKKSLDEEDEDSEEDNPNVMQCYRKYKLDLLTPGVFETILTMIIKALRKPHRERSTVDHTSIRLVLYLLRNLAAIPDLNMPEFGTEEQVRMSHMQEMLLIRFYESDIMEFLLTIASNSERQGGTSEWNMLVLETMYNLIKYVDPKDVFLYKPSEDTKQGELQEIAAKLSTLLSNENSNKRRKTGYTPSRHNRFGGTYVLDWDGKKRVSHKQVAGFADSAFLVEGDKKTNRLGKRRKLEDMLTPKKVYQNRKSLKYLKTVSQSFLTSCFNAFFDCILKDMQRESDSIVEKDFPRYYFTMKWFLEYHNYEHKAARLRKADEFHMPNEDPLPENVDNNDYDYSLVASALNLKTVQYCLRHMRIKLEEKAWFDVQMTVDCFRQMLVTVGEMAKSDIEEHREVAEHIQQNLYYEQASLDLFLDILKRYTNQSYGYLKAVIMLTHVLLKSLDHYQKGKKMMFVRKKKNQKKKKPAKRGEAPEEEEGVAVITAIDSEDESEPEVDKSKEQEYRDIQFKFSTFEQRYVSWDVVHAYTSLLELYQHLKPEYLVCIANMFHRLMVKRKAEYLFWKLPVLELFNRILQNSNKFSESKAFAELEQFIRYSTRQFFKAAAEYPLLYVEALNPSIKSNRTWWEMPSEEEQLEKQRYEQDVNYIPPATWERAEPQQSQANSKADENGLDAAMEDYYYSAFDRRDELEAEGSGATSSNPARTPKEGTFNEPNKSNVPDIFNDQDDELEAAYLEHEASLAKDQEMAEKSHEDRLGSNLVDSEMADV